MARDWYGSTWRAYVPVAKRRNDADKEVLRLRKQGRIVTPIAIAGNKIATTFWGKAWCTNLESYSDYANRLPRGRSYVRNGSVLHLDILEGKVEAIVRGTRTYTVTIAIKTLPKPRWKTVVDLCSGQVTSIVELLQGKMPRGVMEVVSCRERGLFPSPQEIRLECSCPDWATMCKHVAAVMYGVGARLDLQPDLLFLLRAVDASELLSTAAVARAAGAPMAGRTLDAAALGGVFGIEIDEGAPLAPLPATNPKSATATTKATTKKTRSNARRQAIPTPRAAVPSPPSKPTSRITLAELAATGLTLGELADLLASGAIAKTRIDGTYRTTASLRSTLLGRRRGV